MKLQFVMDEGGDQTAVLVPIRKWRAQQKQLSRFKQLMKLKNESVESFREIDEMRNGKRKPHTLDDLINELKNLHIARFRQGSETSHEEISFTQD